jgi:hypothetical protein
MKSNADSHLRFEAERAGVLSTRLHRAGWMVAVLFWLVQPDTARAGTGFTCSFSDGTIGYPYRIQRCSSVAPGNWSDLTNFSYSGPMVTMDPWAGSVTNLFYRAVSP